MADGGSYIVLPSSWGLDLTFLAGPCLFPGWTSRRPQGRGIVLIHDAHRVMASVLQVQGAPARGPSAGTGMPPGMSCPNGKAFLSPFS